MTSRWYLLPLVLIVFVLGFLLGPHGGDGQPAAAQVKLADIPVSGGDWSLGTVHALPILHGPSVAVVRPVRPARAPARRTGGSPSAAPPSTPVGTAPAAAPTPAANAPPAPTSAPPAPAATPPAAKPAPAPASPSSGARFDSTGSSTFDTAR